MERPSGEAKSGSEAAPTARPLGGCEAAPPPDRRPLPAEQGRAPKAAGPGAAQPPLLTVRKTHTGRSACTAADLQLLLACQVVFPPGSAPFAFLSGHEATDSTWPGQHAAGKVGKGPSGTASLFWSPGATLGTHGGHWRVLAGTHSGCCRVLSGTVGFTIKYWDRNKNNRGFCLLGFLLKKYIISNQEKWKKKKTLS